MKGIKIAIFASGTGSNAKNIVNHFKDNSLISIEFILSNKKEAPIVDWCKENNMSCYTFSNEEVNDGIFLADFCLNKGVQYIILAGYLRKIPSEFIHAFENKIINIHPSLLPKFGGKGMYGNYVHEAVVNAKEKNTGITIHFVNENFDEGKHIAQFSCELSDNENISSVSSKIHQLEMSYFPQTIEQVILENQND